MSNENRLVQLNISLNTARFATRSFSSVAIVDVSNYINTAVRVINSENDLTKTEKNLNLKLYNKAQVAFSQDNSAGYVNIINIVPQKTILTVSKTAIINAGDEFSITIGSNTIKYTAKLNDTYTTVISSLTTAINSFFSIDANFTATSLDNAITITDTARKGFIIMNKTNNLSISFDIDSVNNNIGVDLSNALKQSDFFGFALVNKSSDDIVEQAADFAEANKRQFFVSRSDAAILTSVNTDILSKLKTMNYSYTNFIFGNDDNLDIAFMCAGYANSIGNDNFANMTLNAVAVDNLTEGQFLIIKGKNGNTYETIHNVSMTQNGVCTSGEYIDIIRDSCSLYDDVLTGLTQLLVNNKIRYVDSGILEVTENIAKTLDTYVTNGFIAEEETNDDGTANKSYIVQAPKSSSVSSEDKASRTLRNVTFQCRLAGAINHTVIYGSLSYDNIKSGSIAISASIQ